MITDKIEIWKSVKHKLFNNRYMVSNFGRIRSKRYLLLDSKGRNYIKHPKLLKINQDGAGYSIVSLCKNGLEKTTKIHNLVAKAFVRNKYNKPIINHLNGIKTDNRASNLEWCTLSENILHSFKVLGRKGYSVKGKDHSKSISVKQISVKTGKLIKIWASMGDAERATGIDTSAISKVCKGKKKSYGGFIWRYHRNSNSKK